jgi:hypothetical protein
MELMQRLDVKICAWRRIEKSKGCVYQGAYDQHTATIHEALFKKINKGLIQWLSGCSNQGKDNKRQFFFDLR